MAGEPEGVIYAKFNGAPVKVVRAEMRAPEPWRQVHEGVLMRVLPFAQAAPFLSARPLRRSFRVEPPPEAPAP